MPRRHVRRCGSLVVRHSRNKLDFNVNRRNEMKQLSELGISPTPWKVGNIISKRYGTKVATSINSAGNEPVFIEGDLWIKITDARLIAAAPKMYEALRELYITSIEPLGGTREEREKQCERYENALHNALAVLAAAAGESEVKK